MSVQTTSFPLERKLKNLFDSRLRPTKHLHYQLSPEELIADTLSTDEGRLSDTGALVIHTGEFTGRSPKDRFIVKDETSEGTIHWNEFNIPIDPRHFETIYKKVLNYLDQQGDV